MPRPRIELHELLCSVLGSRNAYYQPPSNVQLKYPCIIYDLSKKDTKYANNKKYKKDNLYSLTVIDKNPESEIPSRLDELEYCSYDRHFEADNLHHFTYDLYF